MGKESMVVGYESRSLTLASITLIKLWAAALGRVARYHLDLTWLVMGTMAVSDKLLFSHESLR